MLQQDFDDKEFVFIKDMAYCVEGKFDIFLEEGFKNFKHTFMIRHPEPASQLAVQTIDKSRACGMGLFRSLRGRLSTVTGIVRVY